MPLGKKKDAPERTQHRQQMLDNLGMGGGEMETYEQMLYGGNVDNDEDLEAELLALVGAGSRGTSSSSQKKLVVPPPKKVPTSKSASNMIDLMKDNDSDDGDIDVAEDDPELLAELHEFVGGGSSSPPSPPKRLATPTEKPSSNVDPELIILLQERLGAYQQLLATPSLDSSQARRYDRSLKTIKELMTKASKGLPISEDDVPPPPPKVPPPKPAVVSTAPPQSPPAPQPVRPLSATAAPQIKTPEPPPKVNQRDETVQMLSRRQLEYQQAALKAKKEGNILAAKEYLFVAKQFDSVIHAVKTSSDPIDLSDMPGPPSEWTLGTISFDAPEDIEPEEPPPKAVASGNLLDALRERKIVFEGQLKKAQDSGDSSKVRRLTRIVGQFNEAVVACQKRQPFDYNELPFLPGMAPLPQPSSSSSVPTPGPSTSLPAKSGGNPATVSKQVAFLQQRQAQFKAKALECKQRGEIEKAKEFLRQSKGFDNLIAAASSGLPVDLSKLPSLPGEKAPTVSMLDSSISLECETPAELLSGDKVAIYSRLQAILTEQVDKAVLSMDNLRRAGDLMGSKRLETLISASKHNLALVTQMQQRNMEVPSFHFEWRIFSIPNINPSLAEDEMEFTVLKGVDLALPEGYTDPSQLDTYIMTELVFPTDTPPQTLSSSHVRGTNNPEYNSTIKFKVANRKSRAFQRLVTSKTIKVDIFYRRGFLKKDGLLGSVNVKLVGLEKMSTVEESFDVQNGRKAIGGRLEVRMRIREPLIGGTARESREKWLIIDGAVKSATSTSTKAPNKAESLEVLIYERDLMKQKIEKLNDQLTPMMQETLTNSVREMELRIADLKHRLKEPLRAIEVSQYISSIEPLSKVYGQQAQEALHQGHREKAQISLTKKKLVESEVTQLRSRLK